MNNLVGHFAKSLAGHDKEEIFIIVKQEENYCYLTDGKLRMLDNPKKKKDKHLEISNDISEDVLDKLNNALKITNSDIREAIENYKNNYAKGE